MEHKILVPSSYIGNNKGIDKYLISEEKFVRLFVKDCYIDITNNEFVKHYYRTSHSKCIENYYGDNKHLYLNSQSLFKKKSSHVPPSYKKGYIHKKKYALQHNSSINFVTETYTYVDDTKNKHTYTSYYIEIDDPSIIENVIYKNELCSLLSLFN